MWKYNFPIKEEPALEKLRNVKFQHTNHESIILVIFLVVINLHHWGGFSEWCMLDKKLVQSYKSYQGSSWKGLASHKSKKSIHMQVKDIDLHNSKERRQWRHKSKTQCWISYKSKLNLVDQFCYKSNWIWFDQFCFPPPILIFDRCPVASFNATLEKTNISGQESHKILHWEDTIK